MDDFDRLGASIIEDIARKYRDRHGIPDNQFLGLDWMIHPGRVEDEKRSNMRTEAEYEATAAAFEAPIEWTPDQYKAVQQIETLDFPTLKLWTAADELENHTHPAAIRLCQRVKAHAEAIAEIMRLVNNLLEQLPDEQIVVLSVKERDE